MKKFSLVSVMTLLLAFFALPGHVALANLEDSPDKIASLYGDFRLVVDVDNQVWTRDEWNNKGKRRTTASAYTYNFSRNGYTFTMLVEYDGNMPRAKVKGQRITPDMPIQIKDFKTFLPEIYQLLILPDSQVFAANSTITPNFREKPLSPVSMGIIVKSVPVQSDANYYQLVALNAQGEGALLEDMSKISPDTYVREIVIEHVYRQWVRDRLDTTGKEWKSIPNVFTQTPQVKPQAKPAGTSQPPAQQPPAQAKPQTK